jgi:hypothetical protein
MYKSFLRKIFLPKGEVTKDYVKFIGWSFVSTALVSVQTAMSTHSMLDVVGDSSSRSLNYIGKDIIGQIGGLYYMANVGQKSDKDPVKFLFYSNVVQQTSYMIMSATPMFSPDLFLPLAGVSNTMSNISFIGYGAINAKCIRSLASDGNTGEIYSKITTMNTMASSLGLTAGVAICLFIPEPELRTALLPFIGIARVYAFNKAIDGLIEK